MLKRFLFRPHDHVRLQIGIHVIEIIAVTGYADQKVAIIFRTFLSSIKRLRIDDTVVCVWICVNCVRRAADSSVPERVPEVWVL